MVKPILFSMKKKYVEKQIETERLHEEQIIMRNFRQILFTPLTKEEKQEILKIWAPLLDGRKMSYDELELFKTYRGFDPCYLSHHVYLPLLARRINNYHYTKFFEHKSLLGSLSSKTGMKFPHCFIRSIDQEYYDNEMHQLSKEDAVKICLEQPVLIVKDSVDSSGGQGVKKVVLNDLPSEEKLAKVNCIFKERTRDFVIQECIEQHKDMAQFNPSSINTFRITTLYLNGIFSILSIVLRIGKRGMNVDNWGSGGIILGVNRDGKLREKGFDLSLNEFDEYNGVHFSRTKIEQIPSILKVIESEHKTNFSLCKLIGWDICINSKNEPVIIEVNSSQPGVIGEQLCTGPIFGDRTMEVVEYCARKKFVYNRSMLSY